MDRCECLLILRASGVRYDAFVVAAKESHLEFRTVTKVRGVLEVFTLRCGRQRSRRFNSLRLEWSARLSKGAGWQM